MSLTKLAVLGALTRDETHASALLALLQDIVADPRTVPRSSVYAACQALEAEGLIEARGISDDRFRARAFGATAAGRERFDTWMGSEPSTLDDLRVRLAFVREQDLDALIEAVTAAEEASIRQQRSIAQRDAREAREARTKGWTDMAQDLLGDLRVREVAARAQWLVDVRLTLEALREQRGEGA